MPNINSNSIDRMNRNEAKKEAYNPGRFEMGTVAPSLAGRASFSVKSSKQKNITAEERVDQICALFRARSKKLQALSKKPIDIAMSSINDLLLASEGIEDTVDDEATVKAYVYAMLKGHIASEGFEQAIACSGKHYYVPAKDRDSIYLKSAYGQSFYGGLKALTEVSLIALAKAMDVKVATLSDMVNAGTEETETDVMGDLLNTDIKAFDLASMFHNEGISISAMRDKLKPTINADKTEKVAALMKAMDSCE
jgi:hypothetical protein